MRKKIQYGMGLFDATVIAAVVVSAVLASGCPRARPNVTLEADREATKTIGADGGEVSCTGGNGTVFRLIVPPNALPNAVEIKITPVAEIRNLPLSDGLAGAVELEPSGLLFGKPATLVIETSERPSVGNVIVGFGFEGDATDFAPEVAGEGNGSLKLLVQHFSGAGIGFGTLQEVAAMPDGGFSDEVMAARLVTASAPPVDAAEDTAVLRDYFTTVVLPGLQNASNDSELLQAVSEYRLWASEASTALGLAVIPETSPAFANERQQAAEAAAPQLRAAIDGNNDLGAQNESLSALANVLFWQTQAAQFGVDTVAEQLDRAGVLRDLCAQPRLEEKSIPDPMQAGFPHSLDLRFGLQFVGHPDSQAVPFHVELTADGATLQNPTGFTAVDGSYTTVITATGNEPVTVTAKACLVLPGTTTPTDVCITEEITSNGLDLSGTWTGSFSVFFGNGQLDTADITVVLEQNQNAITGTYEVDEAHFGTVLATLSGNTLLGFTLIQQIDCGGTFTGQATISELGQRIEATFDGQDCHTTHSGGLSSLTRSAPGGKEQ